MILESMKMEIPVIAEDGGTLVEIRVAEGNAGCGRPGAGRGEGMNRQDPFPKVWRRCIRAGGRAVAARARRARATPCIRRRLGGADAVASTTRKAG
jgi:hypothetical protein